MLGWLFRGFNRLFDRQTGLYGRTVGRVLRISLVVLAVYGGLLAMTWWQFTRAPNGFIPQHDKGYLILNVSLPDSAALGRTQRVMARIGALVRDTPASPTPSAFPANLSSSTFTRRTSARCTSCSSRSSSGAVAS